MGLLDLAAAWLPTQLEMTTGRAVTYTRGAESIPLTAVPQEFVFAVSAPSDAARVARSDRTYVVRAAALVLGGVETRPMAGDTITETIRGVACGFKVGTPTGERPWAWADTENLTLLVHCLRVS